jgi:hypothetical protein
MGRLITPYAKHITKQHATQTTHTTSIIKRIFVPTYLSITNVWSREGYDHTMLG